MSTPPAGHWPTSPPTAGAHPPPPSTGSHRPTRAHPPRPRLRTWGRGSGRYPACRCSTSGPSSPVLWSARGCAPPWPRAAGRTTSPGTSRRRCPSSCSRPSRPAPEHDDQEQEPGRPEAVDMTALRALRESRTDVEALDLTAERLRHLGEASTAAADRARTTMNRYARRDGAETPHPVREDEPAGAPCTASTVSNRAHSTAPRPPGAHHSRASAAPVRAPPTEANSWNLAVSVPAASPAASRRRRRSAAAGPSGNSAAARQWPR